MTNNRHFKSIVFFSLIIAHAPIISMMPGTKFHKKSDGRKTPPPTTTTTLTPTPTTTNPLEESCIITTVPTTRGFGVIRSAWDWVKPEEENLFTDLQNKTFDVRNSSYHRKLSTAIETFVHKKNDQRLTEMFEICRKDYRHIIKIEDSPALMAHLFLVEQNKNKQQALRTKLEEADKGAITEMNLSLAALKKTIETQINTMSKSLTTHNESQGKEIEAECNEIRRLKKGLGNIHKLNKTFSKPDTAYCSDDEAQDPEEVTQFYNDTHILEKIVIDKKLNDTKQKIQQMLAKLATINNELQGIQELRY